MTEKNSFGPKCHGCVFFCSEMNLFCCLLPLQLLLVCHQPHLHFSYLSTLRQECEMLVPPYKNQFLLIVLTPLYMAMKFSLLKTNSNTHTLVKNYLCSHREMVQKVLLSIGMCIPNSFKIVRMMGRALRNRLASGQKNRPSITLGSSMRAEIYFRMNT